MAMAIYSGGSRLQALRDSLKRQREKSREATESLVETTMSAGSAFAIGYLEEKYPDLKGANKGIFGIDASLVAGLVGVGIGATGIIKDKTMARYAEALGVGALAAYAASKGAEMARKA